MVDVPFVDGPIVESALQDPQPLASLLGESAKRHTHLCPRQVLGVRIGLAGGRALGMKIPRDDKRLLVIVETDGCFISGVEVATGAGVRHRTMRVEDYGKVAATFVRVGTGEAVRVAPHLDIRDRAWDYAPEERRRYFAMLKAYQRMPEEALVQIAPVRLREPVVDLISRAGVRVTCQRCGEEVINERERWVGGTLLCRACAAPAYYQR